MADLQPIIKESFSQYAGAVLQSRALVDVRDCLKPSARQIFYCMYTDKFIYSKPFKKTLKAVGSAMRMYIHGDSSCEGVIMRAGQPFAMRYPLIEVEGSYGNLMESGNWAAPRYTASRLSEVSDYLFEDINKNTVEEWRDNYDDTEQYPAVLPTKGFYNIVNGTTGIGIGMSSMLPQFNIREVNEALIKLLWNPDISFEEIYCVPDFATGAILLNEEEVKESLRNGKGKSCKLRSVIDYDAKERCLVVTEIPYGVYTNTICSELEKILEAEDNPGVDRFNDLTGSSPLIKIYLRKNANPDKVIKYLYKNTSLQSFYGINMTMLENGRFPKIFTWKEALLAHLSHEKEIYRRGYEFDLNKIETRLHIIDGLLIALANIEEVIQVIKKSSSPKVANQKLQENFLLDDVQAKAILEMKLSRLSNLEVEKVKEEERDLNEKRNTILNILSDEVLFNIQIEKGYRKIADRFGDSRRTKVLNVENMEDEPTEVFSLLINLTNQNNIFVTKESSLYTQKRGGVGTKFKLDKGEYVVSSFNVQNTDTVLFFTNNGFFYSSLASDFLINEKSHLDFIERGFCCTAAPLSSGDKKYIVFVTRKGLVKKSCLSEYSVRRKGAVKALELGEDDCLCAAFLNDNENIGILSAQGYFVMIETKDIRATGRVTKGVKGIKLEASDSVVSAKPIDKGEILVSVSEKGYIKGTPLSDFALNSRYTKGTKIQKLKEDSDQMADFILASNSGNMTMVSNSAQIHVELCDIPIMGKGTQGIKGMKISEKSKIIALVKI